MRARLKSDSLSHHLFDTPLDHTLFELEIRYAIAQKPAHAVRFLEYRHPVSNTIQLLRGCQSRRPRAHHRDALARPHLGRFGRDPSFLPRAFDDGLLDHFDRDRRLVNTKHASRLAGCRADASGKFGEIVGRMQHANRLLPLIAVNEIVPVRNNVVYRAAGVAKRNAAIHAARRLSAHAVFGEFVIDFEIVVDALRYGPPYRSLAGIFLEAGDFTHEWPARPAALRTVPPARQRKHAGCLAHVCIRAGTLSRISAASLPSFAESILTADYPSAHHAA